MVYVNITDHVMFIIVVLIDILKLQNTFVNVFGLTFKVNIIGVVIFMFFHFIDSLWQLS